MRLMQEGVEFQRLALVVVDEQHRFGVHQRLALRDKGKLVGGDASSLQVPHQLVMTATPIPRTLAMSAYADLDVSAIDELPPGRTPIQTIAVSVERRAELVERIRRLREGRQAYWVCTLIDDSTAAIGTSKLAGRRHRRPSRLLQQQLAGAAHRPGPRPAEGRREAGDDARVQGRRACTCWWPPR
jgi:ATP-dependent DNA helicase RecG